MSGAIDRLLRGRSTRRGVDPLTTLFPAQLAAATDPSKRVALLCGRRSGKTQAFLRKALATLARYPGARIPYVALTRQSAKGIVWGEALKANLALGLGLEPRVSDLELRHPNGGTIFLVGANKTDEVEKLRGQAFPLIGIDEAASWRDSLLRYLIEDVLEYALMDYDGQIWLGGTPNAARAGYFFRATTDASDGWSVHRWTALDNPHMPHARAWMETRIRKRGWSWEHPTVQREFLGRWVRDDDALVYKFDREHNMIDAMPYGYTQGARDWAHVIGLDYGYVDAYAWVVWAMRVGGGSSDRTTYAVVAGKLTGKIPTEVADHTRELVTRYAPQRIVGDSGGLGKPYVEETRRRHGIQIIPAEKTAKRAHVELMNDDLRCRPARALLLRGACDAYAEQLELLQWDVGRVESKIGGIIRHEDREREDPRFENDICDAGLYGNRASRAYLNSARPAPQRDLSRDALDDDRDRSDWQQRETRDWWDRD